MLEQDGLPWFYFCRKEGLVESVHEAFEREAEELWGREEPGDGSGDAG
jgi:hypothetical protein